MTDNIKFDYYYGNEAEQFSFYRIPKLLFTNSKFKKLSNDAKLLYGFMLDRLSLSKRNKWIDKANRVYIYYKIENVMEDLNCSKGTAVKVMAELDCKKGLGLIEKKRQGLGRPDIIYVKNFVTIEKELDEKELNNSNINSLSNTEECYKYSDNDEGTNFDIQDEEECNNEDNEISNNSTENIEIYSPECQKIDTNNTEYNKNNINNINLSRSKSKESEIEEIDGYKQLIQKNIEYDYLIENSKRSDKKLIEELYELMCEVVCTKDGDMKISGHKYPLEAVKSRFLKITQSHIEYIINCMKSVTNKIYNIKSYLLTVLYNSTVTMNHSYSLEC